MMNSLSAPALVLYHLLQAVGFILAIMLLARLLREKHGPATTIAWLFSFILIPYAGVPLYLLIGGRKIRRMRRRKSNLNPVPMADGGKIDRNCEGWIPGLFPLRRGGDIRLLTDGEESFDVLLDLINRARESVFITTYVFKCDETGLAILDALIAKANKGVMVRLLVDAVGSFTLNKKHLRRLERAGGRFAFFMPMITIPRGRANLRNHRKIAIIDQEIAMTGGMNLACEYLGPRKLAKRWRDLALVIRGEAVGDLFEVFRSDWEFAANELMPERVLNLDSLSDDHQKTLRVVPGGPDVDEDPLHDAILQHFFGAKESITIVTPYFVPDEMIIKALCVALRRGVAVTIVVPRKSNHRIADFSRRSFLRQIDAAGARVCYYLPGMVHGKLIVIDEKVTITGSMNVDTRSMFLNFEIALLINDQRLIRKLTSWSYDLIGKSRQGVKPANALIESLEGVGRILAPLL